MTCRGPDKPNNEVRRRDEGASEKDATVMRAGRGGAAFSRSEE